VTGAAPSIALAAVLAATAIWSLARLAPLHPAQLWSITWALSSGLYALRLLPYRRISWADAALIAGCACAFVIAAVIAGRRPRAAAPAPGPAAGYATTARAAAIAGAVAAPLMVAYLAQAISRYGLSGAILAPAPLRDAIGRGQLAVTIKYLYPAIAVVALASVAAARASSRRLRLRWLCVAAAGVASLWFATGRATVAQGAIIGACAYCLSRERPLHRRRFIGGIAAAAALTLAVFTAGGALIGNTYHANADLHQVPSVFRSHPLISGLALPYAYASAPIAALGVQIDVASTWGDGHGCATLPPACSALRRVGIEAPAVSRIRPFTSQPLAWNTYTALDAPLIDFGSALAIPALALLGFGIGALWRAALGRGALAITAYSVQAAALVTASGSFNFSASHLLGAILVSAAALAIAGRVRLPAPRPLPAPAAIG
jgi:hypothetical protein